jgi:hypothetical protein
VSTRKIVERVGLPPEVPSRRASPGWAVLVEGASDRVAVEALAERLGRDLAAEGVEVVAIGGAQAIGRYVGALEPETRAAGLVDAGEELAYRRALERAGSGPIATREDLEGRGFFVCDADLEDELIRALGVEQVEAVLERNGDLGAFRTFQKQPQWQGRPADAQLRRHLGASAGKIKYARPLVEALDLARIPRPLEALLAYVRPA